MELKEVLVSARRLALVQLQKGAAACGNAAIVCAGEVSTNVRDGGLGKLCPVGSLRFQHGGIDAAGLLK